MKLHELIEKREASNMALCEPSTSIYEAATIMKEFKCGDVIVVEDKDDYSTLLGILTDRDITLKCVAMDLPTKTTNVNKIMSADPVTCKFSEDEQVALQKMRDNGVSRIVILGEDEQARAVLSADDILKHAVSQLQILSGLSSQQ